MTVIWYNLSAKNARPTHINYDLVDMYFINA